MEHTPLRLFACLAVRHWQRLESRGTNGIYSQPSTYPLSWTDLSFPHSTGTPVYSGGNKVSSDKVYTILIIINSEYTSHIEEADRTDLFMSLMKWSILSVCVWGMMMANGLPPSTFEKMVPSQYKNDEHVQMFPYLFHSSLLLLVYFVMCAFLSTTPLIIIYNITKSLKILCSIYLQLRN